MLPIAVHRVQWHVLISLSLPCLEGVNQNVYERSIIRPYMETGENKNESEREMAEKSLKFESVQMLRKTL